VLRERGELPADELQAEVEQRVVDAGKSRNGFALRFKEAMKDIKATQRALRQPASQKAPSA
jgi:hypothetical protein